MGETWFLNNILLEIQQNVLYLYILFQYFINYILAAIR